MSELGAFSYIYNAVDFDIPFVESIESILPVVDQFILTECYSQDNTWELCQKIQEKYPDKIKLLRREWVKHYTEISSLANWTASFFDKNIDYVVQLQSDEVIHQKDWHTLVQLPNVLKKSGKTAARWKYHHFLGNPKTTFPFCYTKLIRVTERYKGWNIIGDGDQFAKAGGYIPENEVLETNIIVFHYGKMKDPHKGFKKEVSFQDLFKDQGFPDPKMEVMKKELGDEFCDYVFLFENAIKENKIEKFIGSHPASMSNRLALFNDAGWGQFISRVQKELKINKEDNND